MEGCLDASDVEAFRQGMVLRDGTHCQPAGLRVLEPSSHGLVTLQEGKYHQVKRMLAARGKPVLYLKRMAMGGLRLDDQLPAGAYRPLTAQELGILRQGFSED